jgi:hypothetical protein
MLRTMNNFSPDAASGDSWVRDVYQIETAYGRLVYLANLRNPDSGRYEHFGAEASESAAANRTLRALHEAIFREWVALPLQSKKEDIEIYISGIDRADYNELIDAWLRLTPYKNLVPATIQGPERQKHVSDFEAILGLLKNVYGVSSPDQAS